jgi:hypothetical protein
VLLGQMSSRITGRREVSIEGCGPAWTCRCRDVACTPSYLLRAERSISASRNSYRPIQAFQRETTTTRLWHKTHERRRNTTASVVRWGGPWSVTVDQRRAAGFEGPKDAGEERAEDLVTRVVNERLTVMELRITCLEHHLLERQHRQGLCERMGGMSR